MKITAPETVRVAEHANPVRVLGDRIGIMVAFHSMPPGPGPGMELHREIARAFTVGRRVPMPVISETTTGYRT